MCRKFNFRIYTSAAKIPWSKWHNPIPDLTDTKTIEQAKCDLELHLAWAVSVKNSLKMVYGFFLIN